MPSHCYSFEILHSHEDTFRNVNDFGAFNRCIYLGLGQDTKLIAYYYQLW